MAEQIAKFRLTSFSILKSLIEIKEGVEINNKLSVDFKQTSGINEAEHKFKYTFEIVVTDENNALNINVVMNGFFEFDQDIDEKMRASFFNVNAPAILFPYVRAHITTLTSLSGIKPVILPTLNLSSRNEQ